MPKFEKNRTKGRPSEKSQEIDEAFAFRSVKVSLILGMVFLFISLCFNLLDVFSLLELEDSVLLEILDYSIKIASPLFFFLFILISVGNYRDLLGKPIDWLGILGIFLLSLLQTIRNTTVLGGTFIGLIIIIIYFYILKER
ncbi:MAG: hypothetical protein ACFFAS_14725 [Promethearchaeota archaeon]